MAQRGSPSFWQRPDPALAAAGIEGEWLVARVRLAAMALLLITPTWKVINYPEVPVFVWGFAITSTAGLAALAIWWFMRRGWWRPWLGFASSTLDVSLVTTALLTFVFVGSPLVALNSKVTFEIYFLAIVATSLRYDSRICITVGLLAVAQYGALWAFAALRYDLGDPLYAVGVGEHAVVDQITRLILLAAAVLLAYAIVRRAHRLLHLASHDRLTGVYNRAHFDLALGHEVTRAARRGGPLLGGSPRPRSLQAGQRYARTPSWRPGADRGRDTTRGGVASDRCGRQVRRRGVRRAVSGNRSKHRRGSYRSAQGIDCCLDHHRIRSRAQRDVQRGHCGIPGRRCRRDCADHTRGYAAAGRQARRP